MNKRHLLVSVLVAAVCAAILLLFTDLESSPGRWAACGFGAPGDTAAERGCRR